MRARSPKDAENLYQRRPGGVWWVRFTVAGQQTNESLRTRDKRIAIREAQRLKDEAIGRAHRGEERMHWEEAVVAWAAEITGQVQPSTAQRYATSIKELAHAFGTMMVHEIGKREIAAFVKQRRKVVTIATVRRDLQALSSLLGFCDRENWRDGNPARDRMRDLKERRDPIILPPQEDIDAVLASAPPSLAMLARAALLTGARQGELVRAKWNQFHGGQMTLIGKRNKRRVIDLSDEAMALFASIPRHIKSPVIFHHGPDGSLHANPATHFAKVTARVAAAKHKAEEPFVKFRFHDLRHVFSVRDLKAGGNIYRLQKHLGHTSVKTTEMYLEYLSPAEQLHAKGEATDTSQKSLHAPGSEPKLSAKA